MKKVETVVATKKHLAGRAFKIGALVKNIALQPVVHVEDFEIRRRRTIVRRIPEHGQTLVGAQPQPAPAVSKNSEYGLARQPVFFGISGKGNTVILLRLILPNQSVQSGVGSHPQRPGLILVDYINTIAAQAVAMARLVLKMREPPGFPIQAGKPFFGANSKMAVPPLAHRRQLKAATFSV
jgi:hypothetical protein